MKTVDSQVQIATRKDLLERRVPHRTILLTLAVALLMVTLFFMFFIESGASNLADGLLMLSFAVNGLFAGVMLVIEVVRRPFSLRQIHWAFFMCFFVLAPVSQYVFNYWCWGYVLPDSLMLETNVLLLVWSGVFALFSNLRLKQRARESKGAGLFETVPSVSRSAVAILVLLSLISTSALAALVGFDNLFSRSTFSLGLDKTQSLVLESVLRATPLFSFVFVWVRFVRRRDSFVSLLLCAVCLLISDFPAGMPRYSAAVIYGGLSLLMSHKLRETKGLFPLLFLLAFIILFPAINVFRTTEFDLSMFLTAVQRTLKRLPEGFCAGDYDAYSMVARTLQYVRDYGMSMGFQLLTVVLFFVPRAVWPGKGLGSGHTVAVAQMQEFSNISCPLPAEGIINFGVVGLIAFAAVSGYICLRIDNWMLGGRGGGRLFVPFACMFFFFMLRGDLLSSAAFLAGYIVIFSIMLLLVKLTNKRHINEER